jgi:guanine deaminase
LAETRAAYQAQRLLRSDGYLLSPGELLYLATGAGAELMGIPAGELRPGWRADLAVLEPITGSTLAQLLQHTGSPDEALARWITLGGEAEIKATYLQGHLAHQKMSIN